MSNELIAMNEEKKQMYISKEVKTLEDKKAIYNAVNNPDADIADMINKEIDVVDIIMEEIELSETDDQGEYVLDPETGEVLKNTGISTILIDEMGKSYRAVSKGVYNSVKQIVNIFGAPATWNEPLTVVVKQVKVKRGSMLTLDIK